MDDCQKFNSESDQTVSNLGGLAIPSKPENPNNFANDFLKSSSNERDNQLSEAMHTKISFLV